MKKEIKILIALIATAMIVLDSEIFSGIILIVGIGWIAYKLLKEAAEHG